MKYFTKYFMKYFLKRMPPPKLLIDPYSVAVYNTSMQNQNNPEYNAPKSLIAYEKICKMILSGAALPGTRLVLAELEQKLGMGRGPIRDALLLLDKSGLVQNIAYKGAVVMMPPGYREMVLIYEQRCHLETALAVEAMHLATPEDIHSLAAKATEMEMRSQEQGYFFHMDREFHHQLYQLSGMPHLVSIVEHLMDFVQVFLTLRSYSLTHKELFNQQHNVIVQALWQKDEELLRTTLERNIMVGLEAVREELQRFSR